MRAPGRATHVIHYRLTRHARLTISARNIDMSWIERVLECPQSTVPDRADRALSHALGRIPEHGNRVLRVIYNHAEQPPVIVTAYFDRSMRDAL